MIVAKKGVWNLGWMFARNLKMTPSSAMARMTRGSGNMAPRREVDSPSSAPTATIHLSTGMKILRLRVWIK